MSVSSPPQPGLAARESTVASWITRSLAFATPVRLAALQVGAVTIFVALVLATPARGPARLVDLTANEGAHRRLVFWRETAPTWFPISDLSVPHALHTWGIRAILLALVLLQVLAIAGCARETCPSRVRWLLGPAISAIVLLLLAPLSADLFYYAISGYAVTEGVNPYLVPPAGFPDHPLLVLNDWRDLTSPYGPVWTHLSSVTVWLVGPNPIPAAVSFKVFALACAAGLVTLVYGFGFWLTASHHRATVAAVFVAWQPALLVESAGTGHNDALMSLLALAGLWLVVRPDRGSTRVGLVILTLATLVKYATLPVLALAMLWRLTQYRFQRRQLAIAWGLDLSTIGITGVFAFAPYWRGRSTLASLTDEPGRLFTNPLWLLLERIGQVFEGGAPSQASAIGATLATAVASGAFLWLAFRLYNAEPATSLAKIWLPQACAVSLIGLTLLPVNVHAWYLIWPVGVVALWCVCGAWRPARDVVVQHDLGGPTAFRIPVWLWLYFISAAVVYLGYHTRLSQ
ncbi:MAG: hypothetical protein M3R06_03110 [Chloroflexota bacterium]|nr:hypothetical protein [Chloroflexota bacterium]